MDLNIETTVFKIREHLRTYSKSTISMDELYTVVSKNTGIDKDDLCSIEYATFYIVVIALLNESVISKRGKDSNSRGNMSLHINYNNLMKEKKKTLSEEDKLFLHSLNNKIEVKNYFNNLDNLNEDREKLKILSDFLTDEVQNAPYIGINERSYELFGYEKELKNGSKGLLKRVKTSLEDLKCIEAYTPIQCHILKNFYTKESRTILIIENCDTYRSFLLAAKDSVLGGELDMIIFGGGNKITGNFKQHTMYSIDNNDNIYYFGDIDPEGINIFKRVKDANKELNIRLSNKLYKLAIQIGKEKGIRSINNDNQNIPSEEDLNEFKDAFIEKCLTKANNILMQINKLQKLVTIEYNGKKIPLIKVKLNELKEEYKIEKMTTHINKALGQIEDISDAKENKAQIEKISKYLAASQLLEQVIANPKSCEVQIFVPRDETDVTSNAKYVTWGGVTSGGQGNTIYFIVTIALLLFIRELSTDGTSSRQTKVLYADGVFRSSASTYLWECIYAALEENNIQLIVTNMGTPAPLMKMFDTCISLEIHNKKIGGNIVSENRVGHNSFFKSDTRSLKSDNILHNFGEYRLPRKETTRHITDLSVEQMSLL